MNIAGASTVEIIVSILMIIPILILLLPIPFHFIIGLFASGSFVFLGGAVGCWFLSNHYPDNAILKWIPYILWGIGSITMLFSSYFHFDEEYYDKGLYDSEVELNGGSNHLYTVERGPLLPPDEVYIKKHYYYPKLIKKIQLRIASLIPIILALIFLYLKG